jgi:hypothetical protein
VLRAERLIVTADLICIPAPEAGRLIVGIRTAAATVSAA